MDNDQNKKPIRSFRDLNVYQDTYDAMLTVAREVLPELSGSEKYDLRDQLSRSTKAIPRLIAEGYAKKHQKSGFQKYTDDAMAECNESVMSLEQARDLYGLDKELINSLVDIYDKAGRQLYKLAVAWNKFKRTTQPINDTGFVTE